MPERTLPLFDPKAHPPTWNERMVPGEFAVHASNRASCVVFPSFAEAEDYVHDRLRLNPTLRLRVFTHAGFIGEPMLDLRGSQFKGERDLSPRLRRWIGGALLITGSALFAFDWLNNFRFDWPSLVGSRLLIPGVILVFTEWMIVLTQRQKKRQAESLQPFTSEQH